VSVVVSGRATRPGARVSPAAFQTWRDWQLWPGLRRPDWLAERFVVVERGRRRRIPAEEVIYRQQRTKAMSGDLRAAKYLSERKERSPTSEAPKLEDPYDLSRLTDDELGDLERLLSKASDETPDAPPGKSFG
jgi:hypothetical protein